jgi:hypothetical protein
MKALNGRFDFASAPKQGTTATLTLPIGQCTTSILFHETQPAGDLYHDELSLHFPIFQLEHF